MWIEFDLCSFEMSKTRCLFRLWTVNSGDSSSSLVRLCSNCPVMTRNLLKKRPFGGDYGKTSSVVFWCVCKQNTELTPVSFTIFLSIYCVRYIHLNVFFFLSVFDFFNARLVFKVMALGGDYTLGVKLKVAVVWQLGCFLFFTSAWLTGQFFWFLFPKKITCQLDIAVQTKTWFSNLYTVSNGLLSVCKYLIVFWWRFIQLNTKTTLSRFYFKYCFRVHPNF